MFPQASTEPSIPGIGELVADKYRVEHVLGTGGMGSVLAVRHEQLGQVVALKVLAPAACDSEESKERFMREARSAASLRSEHVVKIFDVGSLDSGLPYMVMERLVGSDLSEILDATGPVDVGLAIECAYQACLGVSEAHAEGIVHRDLKPSNLFLSRRRDGTPLVKVLDFGISKAVADHGESVRLTQTRTIVGSPLYMSPEQVRDARRVDERSDIWSLGVILHELLTGRPAFDGDTLPGVCARIVADPPLPVTRADVPPELRAVLDRCLEKDPGLRFATALDVADALRPLRAHYSVSLDEVLGPPSRLVRSSSLMRSPLSSHATVVDNPTTQVSSSPAPMSDLVQSAAALTRSAPDGQLPRPAPARRVAWIGLGLGALVIGCVLALRPSASSTDAPKPSASPAPAPAPEVVESFSLRLLSEPAGAAVLENGEELGTTPMVLPIALKPGATRRFELRHEGFHPYTLIQGSLAAAAEVRAELAPLPAAPQVAPEALEVPEAPKPAPVVRPRPRPKAVKAPAAAAPSTRPESDIRMTR